MDIQFARKFLTHCEQRLGPLSDRKKAELLQDNFSQVNSIEEGLELLKSIESETKAA